MIVLRLLDPAVLNLAGAAAEQAQAQMAQYWATPWYMSILAGLERVFAITLQIAMALLVVRSVARRQPLYLLAAIGLHTAVDFWAVWGAGTLGMVWVEVGVAVFAAFAFWLILRLRGTCPGTRSRADPSAGRHRRRSRPAHPLRRKSWRAGRRHRSTNRAIDIDSDIVQSSFVYRPSEPP